MQIDKNRCRRKDQGLPVVIKHSRARLVLNVSYNIFQQAHGTLSQISTSACGQTPRYPSSVYLPRKSQETHRQPIDADTCRGQAAGAGWRSRVQRKL